MTAPRELASRLDDIAQGLLGGDKRTLKEAAEHLTRDTMTNLKPGLLKAAEICDNYERDGMLRREYACETADELAARIRQPAAELPEPVETATHVNSVVPCYRSDKCSWPACALDCDGRPGRPAPDRIEALEAENARLRKACEALLNQAPIDSEWGYCGWCSNARGHEADCAVALARTALGSAKK